MARFFSTQPLSGTRAVLAGDEAHHLVHVSRVRVGESVALFDGRGGEYPARLEGVSTDAVRFELGPHNPDDRLPITSLTLASAIPKGSRMDVLVQMTCELGVATLVPLLTRRSIVQPGQGKLDHWRRIVVESCKQSGRNRLMTIEEPVSFDEALRRDHPAEGRLMLSPRPAGVALAPHLTHVSSRDILVLVGPEGGFTDEELSWASGQGFLPVTLTPTILRVETAAVTAASTILLTLG